MDKYYEELNKIFMENGYNDFNMAIEEQKLLYLYSYYHYGHADSDNIFDIVDACNFSRADINYEYAYFKDENAEDETIDILSVLIQNNDEFDIKKAELIFSTIETSINQMANGIFTAKNNNSKLREIWEIGSNTILNIKILTNYKTKNEDEKIRYVEEINSFVPRNNKIKFTLIFGDEIEEEVNEILTPRESVESGFFVLDKKNNYLTYGKEESLIVNIMASSLKDNYKKYSKIGLFSMNLRFYVKNAKVDVGIEDSIKNRGDNFWYYNNGIIIVCDDYKVKGNKIFLQNYSIVNGGQTTRMIGETQFDEDFAVSCKIIKNKYSTRLDRLTFVSDIASASNTQKPIKSSDIIANRVEQRLLKSQLSQANIFLQIKRGEVIVNAKENYPEAWQKTKSDELAQFIYSGIYQSPGVSRSNKDSLYSNREKYNTIFAKTYSSELIKNILFIKGYYKKWLKYLSDRSDECSDPQQKVTLRTKLALAKNSLLFTLALILLISKIHYSQELMTLYLSEEEDFEKLQYVYSNLTYDHAIFSKSFKEIKENMFNLYNYVLNEYIYREFIYQKEDKPDLGYSNFTKTDRNYQRIVKLVFKDFERGYPLKLENIINECFYKETEEDYSKTRDLTNELINSYATHSDNEKEALTSTLTKDIIESLKDFRTRTYRSNRIRPYKVFKNSEMERIALKQPKSLEELHFCFEYDADLKTAKFGESILEIVNSVIQNHSDFIL